MSDAIIIGSDHAGFAAKEQVKAYLEAKGLEVVDAGCYSEESVPYPIYAKAVARPISRGEYRRGILICGTGIGVSIVANKFRGVRAALCHNAFTAQASREHNDANILAMGSRVLTWEQMQEIMDLWLETPFGNGRHAERVAMMEQDIE